MVGLIPLFAVEVLEDEVIDRLPGFKKRMRVVPRATARTSPRHISCMEPGVGRRPPPPPAGDPVARAARAGAALHARRERVPLALRHPLAVARPREQPYVLRASAARSTASTTSRPRARPACSAATRTGAGRSGSRSTTCWSRRSSATTTSTATASRSSARPAPASALNLDAGGARARARGWRASSCPTPPAAARATATTRATRRPALARPRAVPRVLPRRHRARRRRRHQTGWTALVVPLLRGLAARRSAGASRPAHAHGHAPVPAGR